MSDTKPTVSIGIPAYNEEANIQQLLTALLEQDQDTFELLEIIVASDGSTDQTVPLAQSFQNPKIKVLDNKDRQGASERQNQILELFKGDILVLLDADILPENNLFISKLILPLIEDSNVGLVSCGALNPKAINLIESTLNFGEKFKYELFKNAKFTDHVLLCHGYARAFSSKLAHSIHWANTAGEDAYSYFYAKKYIFKFVYTDETKIIFRQPQNLKDHTKQSVRFGYSKERMKEFFPEFNIPKEYEIPRTAVVKTLFQSLVKHPVNTSLYFCLQIISMINPYKVKDSGVWEPSTSSKSVV